MSQERALEKVINELCETESLCFDVQLPLTTNKEKVRLEVTEDYEGDKFHVVVFVDGVHWDTVGLHNGNDFFKYLSTVQFWVTNS